MTVLKESGRRYAIVDAVTELAERKASFTPGVADAEIADLAAPVAYADLATGLAPADANKLGSVATKDGALTCAAAIGQEVLDRSSRITVDIAQYEGRPALVVVATGDASSTVWVLSRDCDKSQTPIAGPATVS